MEESKEGNTRTAKAVLRVVEGKERKLMTMRKRVYGAYGSNLNVEQMMSRCPNAKLIGTALLTEYELLYKGSKTGAYLTIEKAKGGIVPLGIWKVDAYDERHLDMYEGYPSFYYKKEFELEVTDIKGNIRTDTVFIYIMDEDRTLALPSIYYVTTCVIGYEDFGFDKAILQQAFLTTQERMM